MSLTAFGPFLNPSSPIVVHQIDRLNTLADQLIDKTEHAVEELQSLTFSNADLDPRLRWNETDLDNLLDQLGPIDGVDPNTSWLGGLDLTAGNENFKFDPNILALLSQQLPEYVLPPAPPLPAFPDAPIDPGEPGALTAPVRPDLPEFAIPDVEVSGTMPVYEDYTNGIPFPTLRTFVLPVPPTTLLDEIKFEGVKPTFEGQIPDIAEFEFNGKEYVPLLLDRVKVEIVGILDGGRGLPQSVEDAIFERSREREVELGERDVDQARNEYAAKGYKYSPGAVAARTDLARFNASKKVSALNRDQTIEGWKIQIDLYKTALASAIQLEDLWMRQYSTGERLRFEAAQMRLQFATQIFAAFVQRFNAEASMFQAESAVYRDRLQAEATKIQAYSAQLEGLRLIGELNQQDVAIFVERVKTLAVNADIYKARVEGYSAQFQAVSARVEVFKAELESNKTLIETYDVETKAFATMAQAQAARDQRYVAKADIFAKTVDARAKQTDVAMQVYDINFKKAQLIRDTYIANSERVREMIAAEQARIQALTEKYQALASEIGAKADVEKAKYALLLSIAQARVDRMKAAAEILLKNGEVMIQSALTAEGLMLRAKETSATTLAQLAAGFTSAANVSAGISESFSSGVNYSFSGELDVA